MREVVTIVEVVVDGLVFVQPGEVAQVYAVAVAEAAVAHRRVAVPHDVGQLRVLLRQGVVERCRIVVEASQIVAAVAQHVLFLLAEIHGLHGGLPEHSVGKFAYTQIAAFAPYALAFVFQFQVDGCALGRCLIAERLDMLMIFQHLYRGHIVCPDTFRSQIVAAAQHVEILYVKVIDGRPLVFDHAVVLDRDAGELPEHIADGAVVTACVGGDEVVERVAASPQLLRLDLHLAQHNALPFRPEVECLRGILYSLHLLFDIESSHPYQQLLESRRGAHRVASLLVGSGICDDAGVGGLQQGYDAVFHRFVAAAHPSAHAY